MRRMAASVCVITTVDDTGEPRAMTATSVTSLSMDPPAMLVCVNRWADIHQPMAAGTAFCINILHRSQQEIAERCARANPGENYLRAAPWTLSATGLAHLPDAQACIFCDVDQTIPYTTHSIFIGTVSEVRTHGESAPLIHLDGAYR